MGFDKLSPSGKFRTRNAILRIADAKAVPMGGCTFSLWVD
jgi:hypothetical protein